MGSSPRVRRACGPVHAGLCGGLWGLTLGILTAKSAASGSMLSLGSLLLLGAAPAAYACLGSRLTRWIGYSPFVLGVGWMGVELVFDGMGLSSGLWISIQSEPR